MALRCCGLAAVLVALPLGAGTIDVSAQVAALLDTGDALSFTVPSWNFGVNAAHFGLPVYPTSVGFVFISAAEDSLARIEAVLMSGDGSVSVSFGAPLSFVPGTFHGSRYSGSISVLVGSLQLSEALSQQLFGDSPAVLTLRNIGPALTVGLAPYTLQQDMNVSLGGGGLSVGAPLDGVALMHSESDTTETPEPRSWALLLGGGGLLWALAALRQSELARRTERALERNSNELAAGSHARLLK
jgi:hypothetical protein